MSDSHHLVRTTSRPRTLAALASAVVLLMVSALRATATQDVRGAEHRLPARPVAGSGVHAFSTSIVHAQEETSASGMIQRSSDVVTLTGDLSGHLLYHPTSAFDYAKGTLVNTGTQVFSGTVLDSPPVILHDDRFRFEVDLETGATIGEVHLGRSSDAPHAGYWYECHLQIVGTGLTPEGDATFSYRGECARVERR
jgi:hypothetical protein